MKSRAMAQVADRTYENVELEIPPVGADEALLRVEACGLCGSDLSQYQGKLTAKGHVRYPVIPGHEPTGIIEEIGPVAAQNWGVKKGDRVAIEPHLTCSRCDYCLGGKHHLCHSLFPAGSAPVPSYGYMPMSFGHGLWGGYSEFIHLHARTLICKLPASIPPKFATMYQALACGLRWAVQVPEVTFQDSVLVMGCGQRGLASVIMLRQAGVRQIIVTGLARDRHKLLLARQLGASHTIEVDREDTVARVMEITNGRGVDVAVDIVPGSTQPLVDGIEVVRPSGTIVIAGYKGGDRLSSFDSDRLLYKELSIKGVFTQPMDCYVAAIDLMSRELERIAPLHTHEFGTTDVERAMPLLAGEVEGEDAICISLHPDWD